MPAINVILPFFNAGKTLERAVESILNQNFTDFELILVNNNSTDKSLSIAERMAINDKRIKIITEKKQGVMHAFNTGVAASSAPFIARMDADDLAFKKRLMLEYEFLQQNQDYEAVCGQAEYKSNMPNTKGFRMYVNWVNALKNAHEISLNRFIESPVINPTAMFRRQTGEKYGFYYQGDFPEDYEMWLRWIKNGVKIGKINQALIQWNDSATRLTRTDKRYSSMAFYRIKTSYFFDWLKHNNPFHPEITIWGAGRTARRRARLLINKGIKVKEWVDVVDYKRKSTPYLHYSDLPKAGRRFVVSYVASRGARQKIRHYLQAKNYMEGEDFMMMA